MRVNSQTSVANYHILYDESYKYHIFNVKSISNFIPINYVDWSKLSKLVEKDKNLEQKVKKLEENLNELKLMAESNSHAINDTLIPDVIENSQKLEDIQREVDENHDNILELKTNGNPKN